MDLASISLGALALAIVVSCTTRINVGFLSLVLAWIIGVLLAGMKSSEVAAGFPVQLFLTLTGVTLLFAEARANGTLERIAYYAVSICKGNLGLIPVAFFLVTLGMASIGAGNIAAAALIAPMAMAVAGRIGISAFLMTIMVGNGANAGSLSPFAPTGIIVHGLMDQMGLGGVQWQTYVNNLVAHVAVAFAGYLLLGGWRLFGRTHVDTDEVGQDQSQDHSFEARHWVTMGAITALISGVIFFELDVGMGAFTAAVLLALLRMTDEATAIRLIPWGVILMVTGVTVLVSLLEKTGGMDLFTSILARFSTPDSITAVVALVTGLISAYSSTSGVVLPAFLPTVPSLIERLGGGDALAIASSMNLGSHLVDVSPLSTIGALCIAAVPPSEDSRILFYKVLAWGLSMSVVGMVVSYVFFGLLW
ncbi:MAG: SLC13 family permease [Acidobacteriota bacterium]